ncbi:hypothetical protein [Marimonas lutisalis]|uniref:hypothetical protein n=1 Tax=Marimonas lutisalis TaxID=2545756 RepID=UPI0010FA272B|nr:hypothetical protein [Marimonas lutisalis]
MNVEIDQGTTERHLYSVFYGSEAGADDIGSRKLAVCASFVLKPLVWSGLIFEEDGERDGKNERHYFKTPLWRSVLELDLDEDLPPIQKH